MKHIELIWSDEESYLARIDAMLQCSGASSRKLEGHVCVFSAAVTQLFCLTTDITDAVDEFRRDLTLGVLARIAEDQLSFYHRLEWESHILIEPITFCLDFATGEPADDLGLVVVAYAGHRLFCFASEFPMDSTLLRDREILRSQLNAEDAF